MRLSLLAVAAVLAASPAAAQSPETAAVAARNTIELAGVTRDTPGAAPGLAVVVVRRGEAPMIYVDGVADARTGTPATADTPFYIASMTKAYVGLMAEVLDRQGVFDLDATLTDVWPDLTLPGNDASAITFRQLLTHHAPIENSTLSFRTAYTDEVPANAYPAILARFTQGREPGFEYSNLGYLIYGAALEARTGRHWRDWLEHALFEPLEMSRTYASVSDTGAAAAHQWGGDLGWIGREAKQDPLMHAAGGLVTSPRDMARWLQLQLEGAPALPEGALAAAQQPILADIGRPEGFDCEGYALGWNVCEISGSRVLFHGGGYTGSRSWMAFAPEAGVGIAVMANSDSMTGGLGMRLIRTFFSQLAGEAAPDPAAFAAQYRDEVARQLAARLERNDQARAQESWLGWAWRPGPEELDSYVGRYSHERLGDMVVERDDDGLTMRLGLMRMRLEPAAPDLFGATLDALSPPSAVSFDRTDGGLALTWDDDRFVRAD